MPDTDPPENDDKSRVTLSVITTTDPAAGQLPLLLSNLDKLTHQLDGPLDVIIVDDLKQWTGEDQALKAIKAIAPGLSVRVIWYPERRGQLAAVMAGIGAAGGDAVLTLDPDIGQVLEEVPAMLQRLAGGCLIVHGRRPARPGLGLLRRAGSRLANITVRLLTGIRVDDIGSPVTLFSADILPTLADIPPGIHNPRLFVYRRHADRLCQHDLREPVDAEGPSHYNAAALVMLYLELVRQCLRIRRALPRHGE